MSELQDDIAWLRTHPIYSRYHNIADALDAKDAEIARLTKSCDEWRARAAELADGNAALRARLDETTAMRDIAQGEIGNLRARLADAERDAERLRRGLKFYADGDHFQNDGAFDTVSGEPQNFWCDQEGSMIEDGTVAKKFLEGWDVDDNEEWIMPAFNAANAARNRDNV